MTLKTFIDGTEIPKMTEFCAQINALPRKGESLIKATVELLNSFQPFRTRNDSLGIEANAMTIDLFVKGPKAFVTLFVIFLSNLTLEWSHKRMYAMNGR